MKEQTEQYLDILKRMSQHPGEYTTIDERVDAFIKENPKDKEFINKFKNSIK